MKLAIRLARNSIRSHKLRSRFATVGVVISVFLVSLVFIISDSLRLNIKNQLTQLNTNTVIISGSTANKLLNISLTPPANSLTEKDALNLEKITTNKDGIIKNQFIVGNINYDDEISDNTTTIATSAINPTKLGLEINYGDWFDVSSSNKKWVVLGQDLANQLLGTDTPQNQIVDIKGQKFIVIGVLKQVRQPLSILGYNPDKSAFISLKNGHELSDHQDIGQIILPTDNVTTTKSKIAGALGTTHTDSSDYNIETGADIAAKLTEIVNYLTIAACILAAIILLVSIISIANTMLVGTVERRREIGIRKAVGATTKNIISQFLAESVIMSINGGIIGLVLAYLVAALALIFLSIPVSFSWLAIGVGFIIPIVTGIIAGIYPAYRASKQDIIEALNQLT